MGRRKKADVAVVLQPIKRARTTDDNNGRSSVGRSKSDPQHHPGVQQPCLSSTTFWATTASLTSLDESRRMLVRPDDYVTLSVTYDRHVDSFVLDGICGEESIKPYEFDIRVREMATHHDFRRAVHQATRNCIEVSWICFTDRYGGRREWLLGKDAGNSLVSWSGSSAIRVGSCWSCRIGDVGDDEGWTPGWDVPSLPPNTTNHLLWNRQKLIRKEALDLVRCIREVRLSRPDARLYDEGLEMALVSSGTLNAAGSNDGALTKFKKLYKEEIEVVQDGWTLVRNSAENDIPVSNCMSLWMFWVTIKTDAAAFQEYFDVGVRETVLKVIEETGDSLSLEFLRPFSPATESNDGISKETVNKVEDPTPEPETDDGRSLMTLLIICDSLDHL